MTEALVLPQDARINFWKGNVSNVHLDALVERLRVSNPPFESSSMLVANSNPILDGEEGCFLKAPAYLLSVYLQDLETGYRDLYTCSYWKNKEGYFDCGEHKELFRMNYVLLGQGQYLSLVMWDTKTVSKDEDEFDLRPFIIGFVGEPDAAEGLALAALETIGLKLDACDTTGMAMLKTEHDETDLFLLEELKVL